MSNATRVAASGNIPFSDDVESQWQCMHFPNMNDVEKLGLYTVYFIIINEILDICGCNVYRHFRPQLYACNSFVYQFVHINIPHSCVIY